MPLLPAANNGPASDALPTWQDGNWQHNSTNYEAASSLSSLSLIIAETPTTPPRKPQQPTRRTENVPSVDELDTQPPPIAALSPRITAVRPVEPEILHALGSLSLRDVLDIPPQALVVSSSTALVPYPDVTEIDTVPERHSASERALVPARQSERALPVDAAGWRGNAAATTSEADRLRAMRLQPGQHHRARRFRPLDRLRWWLLRPGHMEFLLWVVGSILLFGITFLLLLATVLSVMLPSAHGSGNFPNSAATATFVSKQPAPGVALHLALLGKPTLTPGSELQLHGQGFTPWARITIELDGRWPLLNQHGQSALVQADASGGFTANLWLGDWSSGAHQLLARVVGASQQVSLPIMLTSGSLSQSTPSQPTQVVNNPAPQPTSAPRTYPTPVPDPTAAVPTPLPSATPTPGATPTVGVTVTPTPPLSTPTPVKGSAPSNLGNSLNNANSDSLLGRLSSLNPLVWLIVVCYFLSMILLGLAGLLRYRRPARRSRAS